MSTLILEAPRATALSKGWIISKRDDLLWFIGGNLLGYIALLIAFKFGAIPRGIGLAWTLLLNNPHVFSTATRAVFDSVERKRIGRLWFLLIPLCAVVPLSYPFLGILGYYWIVVFWGHYHVSKQHMGFVMLYKKKGQDRADFQLDKNFTLISLMLPLAYYVAVLLTHTNVPTLLTFIGIQVASCAYYIRHCSTVRLPKTLLMLAAIPLSWAAFIYAATDTTSTDRLLVVIIATNIGHSFQYLRLMWFHNHNRYAQSTGLLGFISSKRIYFFVAVFLMSAPSHILKEFGLIASGIFAGILFFHYTVDAKLWRVRGDKELASALRLN